eukprot:TRINITY_DN4492_c1_g1_i2.p1 TRINITY_DN4492_c1_g1~~TRINITY_DN4492_c1_g1_i2.p1  ORF type:complete len:1135 (+),score=374.05 TRINITY_DN4492_c1_g1_i2:1039-4443(+)
MLRGVQDEHEQELRARDSKLAAAEQELERCKADLDRARREQKKASATPSVVHRLVPPSFSRQVKAVDDSKTPAPEGRVCCMIASVDGAERLWVLCEAAMARATDLFTKSFRKCVDRFGGYEVKHVDSSHFFVVFPEPLDAVKCSQSLQLALLDRTDWPAELDDDAEHPTRPSTRSPDGDELEVPDFIWRGLRVRVALHIGEPLCGRDPTSGRMDYYGPCVHTAGAIAKVARPGMVAASAAVVDAVGKAALEQDPVYPCLCNMHVVLRLRGTEEKVEIHRLTARALAEREDAFIAALDAELRQAKRRRLQVLDGSEADDDESKSAADTNASPDPEDVLPSPMEDSELRCLSEPGDDGAAAEQHHPAGVVVVAHVHGAAAVRREISEASEWRQLLGTFRACLDRACRPPWAPPLAARTPETADATEVRVAFADAAAAVRWCLAAQEELMAASWPDYLDVFPAARTQSWRDRTVTHGLRARIGVHSHPLVVTSDPLLPRALTFRCDEMHIAEALATHATGGQVLLTEAVFVGAVRHMQSLQSPVMTLLGTLDGVTLYQTIPRHLIGRMFLQMGFEDSAVGRADEQYNTAALKLMEEELRRAKDSPEAVDEEERARLAGMQQRAEADVAHAQLALRALSEAAQELALEVGLSESGPVTRRLEQVERWLMTREDSRMAEDMHTEAELTFSLREVGAIAAYAERTAATRRRSSAFASPMSPPPNVSKRLAFRRFSANSSDGSEDACSPILAAGDQGFDCDLDPSARRRPSVANPEERLSKAKVRTEEPLDVRHRKAVELLRQLHGQTRSLRNLLREFLDPSDVASRTVVEEELFSRWLQSCKGETGRRRPGTEMKALCSFAVEEQEEQRNTGFQTNVNRLSRSALGHLSHIVGWAKAVGKRVRSQMPAQPVKKSRSLVSGQRDAGSMSQRHSLNSSMHLIRAIRRASTDVGSRRTSMQSEGQSPRKPSWFRPPGRSSVSVPAAPALSRTSSRESLTASPQSLQLPAAAAPPSPVPAPVADAAAAQRKKSIDWKAGPVSGQAELRPRRKKGGASGGSTPAGSDDGSGVDTGAFIRKVSNVRRLTGITDARRPVPQLNRFNSMVSPSSSRSAASESPRRRRASTSVRQTPSATPGSPRKPVS